MSSHFCTNAGNPSMDPSIRLPRPPPTRRVSTCDKENNGSEYPRSLSRLPSVLYLFTSIAAALSTAVLWGGQNVRRGRFLRLHLKLRLLCLLLRQLCLRLGAPLFYRPCGRLNVVLREHMFRAMASFLKSGVAHGARILSLL